MKAKKRYAILAMVSVLLLGLFYYFGHAKYEVKSGGRSRKSRSVNSLQPYITEGLDETLHQEDLHISPKQSRETRANVYKNKQCRMESCFDFAKCKGEFLVYVYPETADRVSEVYAKILTSLRESRYYTDDPRRACLFVLSIDTIDRDRLSVDYVKNIQARIHSLPLWNGGRNHLIFNLYSGTWPEYTEDLGFDIGEAMLAKASLPSTNFRPNFDISIPLFSKDHPLRGGKKGDLQANNYPLAKKYLLAFKGKRYLAGIGSETRNALYHIHNDEDIVLLTTCKHGVGWQRIQDTRCQHDNEEFDRYDYQTLLHNSTFCLVPRGRRLGSFRFLESLQAACVPVLLSNGWELPFSEVLDWSRASVQGDERLLLQIPSIVRSVGHEDILATRQQIQFLWDTYLSSVEKIVQTTLEILHSRVVSRAAHQKQAWNQLPGGLATPRGYADTLARFPANHLTLNVSAPAGFSAIIQATSPLVSQSSPILRLIRNLAASAYVAEIIIVWNVPDRPVPLPGKWPQLKIPLIVVEGEPEAPGSKFTASLNAKMEAILSLDEDVQITKDEVDFAFSVWQSFPDRIVGYPARSHFWKEGPGQGQGTWAYTSKWLNHYSMVLTAAAFYHRYYGYMYANYLSEASRRVVERGNRCEDLLMNFLVSHLTRLPPIKVTQRKEYREGAERGVPAAPEQGRAGWADPEQFAARQQCLNRLTQLFGYMPLIKSRVRLDPVLFKDPVSNLRKKYRQIERI